MKLLLLLLFFTMLHFQSVGQNAGTFMAEVKLDSLVKTVKELTGEVSVIINGINTKITSRAAYLGYTLAEEYLKQKLAGYHLEIQTQKYSINGLNVLGIQKGIKHPEITYIVGAHHDAAHYFCADDNASGVAAVLETARIFSGKYFENTIVFALWDEEEAGLWGSTHYAKQAKANGQAIHGIINMDMLGYDSNNDKKFDINVCNDPVSLRFADTMVSLVKEYKLALDPQIINPGNDDSDHAAFWKQGYLNAISCGERFYTDDPNPSYHTENDRISLFNIPYFVELSKLTVGLMASLATPIVTETDHKAAIPEISDARIYPNPTNGILTIEPGSENETQILVQDIYGRVISSTKSIYPSTTLDLSKNKQGIYLVTLKDEKNILTKKVIKTD